MPERVSAQGDNVTDATRVDALMECTDSFRELQLAAEGAKAARSEHSARLKKWKGRGLNIEALKRAVKDRLVDPDDILKELHEYTRLRSLQNMPRIQTDLMAMWAPVGDDHELEAQRQRWRDDGARAARAGHSADDNPNIPGSEEYVCWQYGWENDPQRIAKEMGQNSRPGVNTSRRRSGNGAATTRRAPPADDRPAA